MPVRQCEPAFRELVPLRAQGREIVRLGQRCVELLPCLRQRRKRILLYGGYRCRLGGSRRFAG